MKTEWYRVTKRNPCRICQHPDWCTWQEDGSACCMRVPSDRPMRNGGWLHKPDGSTSQIPAGRTQSPQEPRLTPRQCLDLWRSCKAATTPNMLETHADQLGVSPDALAALDAVWSGQHKAWLWPMRDANGTMIGLRVRNTAGDKWAVRGSRAGLFLPTSIFPGRLYIVEGPTDTAAMLTLGLSAIGRPSCQGQEQMLVAYVRACRATDVVIVADADKPGQRGAEQLQPLLPVKSLILTLPAKDPRAFLLAGGSAAMIVSMVRDMYFTWPTARSRTA